MTGKVRDAASWKGMTDMQVRDTTWKAVLQAWVREAGTWKEFFVAAPAGFTGFIRPDADIETSGWTSTPLWSKLDEVSPDDASTEITSGSYTAICPSTQNRDFTVGMSNPASAPTGSETITLRVRIWLHQTAGGPSTTKILTMQVKELTTSRALTTRTISASGYSTQTFILSTAQKASVGNWDDIRIRCNLKVCGTGGFPNPVAHSHVTWIEMEFVA